MAIYIPETKWGVKELLRDSNRIIDPMHIHYHNSRIPCNLTIEHMFFCFLFDNVVYSIHWSTIIVFI